MQCLLAKKRAIRQYVDLIVNVFEENPETSFSEEDESNAS